MAVLGGQEIDAPVSRVAGVVKNTLALIVTEGYVGVCCTSLKKLCAIMKKHILRSREAIAPLTRDPAFDGRVIPAYWEFPHNVTACTNITDAMWNPPT